MYPIFLINKVSKNCGIWHADSMCSTICENAVNDSTWGGCLEAAEDERQTTAREFPAHAPRALELLSKPTADLDCHIALVEHNSRAFGSTIANQVQERLRRSIKKNFEGREYVTRPTILQAVSKDVVHCLVQPHISEWTHWEIAKQLPMDSIEDLVSYIDAEAKVLLALCIFVGAPMRTFLKLLEAGTRDRSLPLTQECPTGVDGASFVSILEIQRTFVPHDLFAQPGQVALPEDLVIPLIFDKERDLIGSGAYSDVFRVTVDNVNCSPLPKREGESTYAVKRFKSANPYAEQSFDREYSVLQELVKIPHTHILIHLAAWSQAGVFYMIFPQARYNLRTFMEEVEYPSMRTENVVWFFKQLRGLADAVRHIHALRPLPALYQYRKDRPIVTSSQAVFHNDIKPENILTFDSTDGSPGVFKISDFGSGKVVSKDQRGPQQTTEGFYGTPEYESPDVVRDKEASKPNDLWALGCVFLELLDWFTIPSTEKQMSFQSQRYTGPGPRSPAFWYRNPEDKFQLKPQVGRKLMDLETHCYGKRALEGLLVVVWSMCDVEQKDRSTAERVYNDLNHLTRQTMLDSSRDPECFLRPGGLGVSSHLWRTAFPAPSYMGGGGIDGDPTAVTTSWGYLHHQIRDFNGDNPSAMDKRLTQPPVKKDGPLRPEERRGNNSPFARKLQRLQEADLR